MSPRVWFRFMTLIVLHVAYASAALAVDPEKTAYQYLIDSWSTVDGLPQSTVTGIVQDSNGYLWIGTLEGLARFDGTRFRLFNTRTTLAFSSNAIVSLLSDRQGNLWAGTTDGGLVRQTAGIFESLSNRENAPTTRVSSLFEDPKGVIWIGTIGEGLLRYEGGRIDLAPQWDTLGDVINTIDGSGSQLWLGTNNGLLLVETSEPTTSNRVERYATGQRILSVTSTEDGSIYFGAQNGLFQLKDGDLISYESAVGEPVTALLHDSHGTLWVGTDGGGLYRLRLSRDDLRIDKLNVTDDSVIALTMDSDESLWVGTNLGGLNRIRDGDITMYTQRDGLIENFTRAVYEDSRGDLWIGSESGGVLRYRDGVINQVPELLTYASASFFAVVETADGVMWFGTDRGLIALRDKEVTVLGTEDGLASNIILALADGGDGSLWIGSYQGGMNRIREGQVVPTPFAFNSLDSLTVNVVLHTAEDGLWIGTRGQGLFQWHDDELKTYSTENGLTSNMVFSLYQSRKRDLWVGTYGGGIARLRDKQWDTLTEANGLFDNVVHRMINDDRGRLWMSSNRGISSVSIEAIEAAMDEGGSISDVNVYNTTDGLADVECNGGSSAGTMTSDGYLWFPTVAGLARLDPDARVKHLRSRSIFVEAFFLNGVETTTAAGDLEPGTNDVRIDYSAIHLARPDQLNFRYRLEGYDEDWVYAGSRRKASYTQLAAGRYAFFLEASLNHGPWQRADQIPRFTVYARFYETLWFYALVLFFFIALSILLARMQQARLHTRNSELAKLVSSRTQELETANSQLLKLANEDGLTGLLNRRAFDDLLDVECRRARRSGIPFSLLLLDVDHFKAFNDALGHQAGDACLRTLAIELEASCNRAGESVARYGGEEIAIIMPAVPLEHAIQRAEQLRIKIQSLAIEHPASKTQRFVSVSIGVCCSSQFSNITAATLVESVDKALYRAKKQGRNQVAIAQ